MDSGDISRFDYLKLRHLKLLELLHETGSLRRAAELLFVTQPAVTLMLQELEKMFDAPLVLRSHRGVKLTGAGMEVRERLRVALNEISTARHAARHAYRPEYLRIGALPTVLIDLLPEAISKLHVAGTLPRIWIREGTVETLLSALIKGELDCVVARMGSFRESSKFLDELRFDIIGEESLHMICSADNALKKKKEVKLDEVVSLPWIVPHVGSLTRDVFNDIFLREGLRPPLPTIESMSFYSNINIVMRTNMLTLAPTTAVKRFGKSVHVLPVPLAYTPAPIGLISRLKNMDMSSIQLLRQELLLLRSEL